MSNSERSRGVGAAARVAALASSVMDLHVRIAVQEMDKEKRRLICGSVFIAIGGVLMLFALLALEIIFGIWIEGTFSFSIQYTLIILGSINLFLAGLSLKLGGKLLKGPYLPETLEGLSKTTKAVLGKS